MQKQIFSFIKGLLLLSCLIQIDATTGMMPPPMGGTTGMMPSSSTTSGTVCGTAAGTNSFTYTEVTDDASGSTTGFPCGYREISANGCPGYDWTSQTTPNKATEQSVKIKLPLCPKISTTLWPTGIKNVDGTTNSNPSKGAIGISINGVALFGNADANNGDAYINEGKTFDTCNGHPQDAGIYHYHMEPAATCGVFKDVAGSHSPLFGFMYDGIPIYGELGDSGIAPTDLDSCGGHTDKTYPYYHYHLPKDKAFPYLTACLKGCIYTNNGNMSIDTSFIKSVSTCTLATTQYDYTALNGKVPQITLASGGTVTTGTTSGSSSFLTLSLWISLISFFFI